MPLQAAEPPLAATAGLLACHCARVCAQVRPLSCNSSCLSRLTHAQMPCALHRAWPLRMPGRGVARAAAAAHLSDGLGAATATLAARQRRPLDTFFPFDPYLLRHSAAQLDLRRAYIKCVCVHATAAEQQLTARVRRWQSSDGDGHDAVDGGDESDEYSTLSGVDELGGSLADDSFREGHLFVPVQAGLARPAPLGAAAMSYEEAAVLSGSSFGGLSLQ